MEILKYYFCDYCGKSFKSENIKYESFDSFLDSESSKEMKKYKDEITGLYESGFQLCKNCKDETLKEIQEIYKKRFQRLSLQYAKNQKIREIFLTGFEAQIQNYLKEND